MPLPATDTPVFSQTRRLMRHEAYDTLRELIVLGTLQAGEPLRDQEIGRWLGISRMPVREALVRLADDGLVVIAANRFTRVAPLDRRSAVESHRLVGLLEGEIAARAAGAEIGGDALRELAETFRWSLWRGDASETTAADDAFHGAIRAAASHPSGIPLTAQLVAKLQPLARRAQLAAWAAVAQSWPEHAHLELVAALERGEVEAARTAAAEEWRSLGETVAQALGSRAGAR